MAPADPLWLGTPQIWEDPRDETFIALAEAEQLKPTQGYRKEASEFWIQKVQEQLIEDPLESPPDPVGAARNRGYDDSLDSPSDPIASTRSRSRRPHITRQPSTPLPSFITGGGDSSFNPLVAVRQKGNLDSTSGPGGEDHLFDS